MLDANEVSEAFKVHLSSKARRGALLISGKWGSGKTYLLRRTLFSIAQEKGFRPIYISVADIDSYEGFERGMLLASIPLLEDKKSSRFAKLGFGFANSVLTKNGTALSDIISITDLIKEKTLVCIDDLERSSPEIRKRILYRLANLAELTAAKTLVMADEDQIQDAEYPKIKEKAIGRTVKFQPTYEQLAATAVELVYGSPPLLKTPPAWSIESIFTANQFQEILANVLRRGLCSNLRTAIAATVDACEIFEAVGKMSNHTNKQSRSLIHSTLAYSVELKNASSNSENLRTLVNSGAIFPWVHFLNNGDPKKAYLSDFETKYIDGVKTEFLRSSAVLDFVEHGSLNPKIICEALAALAATDEKSPAYKRLARYQSLSLDEFTLLAQDAVNELTHLRIRSLHELAESAHTLFFLAGKRLLKQNTTELRLVFSEAIEQLAIAYKAGSDDISPSYDSTLFGSQAGVDLKSVLDQLHTTSNDLDALRFKRFKGTQIKKLAEEPAEFVTALVALDSQIATRSCLDEDDALQIFRILREVVSGNKTPQLNVHKLERAISYRYLSQGLGRNFPEEERFLKILLEKSGFIEIPDGAILLENAITELQDTLEKAILVFTS